MRPPGFGATVSAMALLLTTCGGCQLDRTPLPRPIESQLQGCFERTGSPDLIVMYQVSPTLLKGTGAGFDPALGPSWSFTGVIATATTATITVDRVGGGTRTFSLSFRQPNVLVSPLNLTLTPCRRGP